ncbi:hypothetical protein DL764_007117 [Monosporascus ibericus]|uniref:Uncharacterized protein n=1 Tax=Monosporascus ibericus TaxID=155417 RepID=A0A4Q4T590_9PEZI|nr:hypothetical protein DL764_007117 [Monosporascus ibericus]
MTPVYKLDLLRMPNSCAPISASHNSAAEGAKYVGGSKLDENDIAGSLSKEVEGLMFDPGACSFSVGSWSGSASTARCSCSPSSRPSVSSTPSQWMSSFRGDLPEQLQAQCGPSLSRTINATLKQASPENKRVVMRKIPYENANADDPVIEDDIEGNVKGEEDVVQEGEEAAQNEKAAAEEEVAAKDVEATEEGQAAEENAAEDEAAAADEEAESDEKVAEEAVAQGEEGSNANAT